jgi:hypothetical protein
MSQQEREQGPLTTADVAAGGQPRAQEAPVGAPPADREITRAEREVTRAERGAADVAQAETQAAPLLPGEEATGLRTRWQEIQAGFVDEPRQAVQKADELVAGAMKRLAEVFAEERSKLETQWDRGGDVSTEDLRVALRRYRSFFDRLLSV